jgi:hypothetical protein
MLSLAVAPGHRDAFIKAGAGIAASGCFTRGPSATTCNAIWHRASPASGRTVHETEENMTRSPMFQVGISECFDWARLC